MPRKFTITTPSETVRLGDNGRGNVVFTLTNTSGTLQPVLIRAAPLGNTQAAWLSVQQPEREFPSGGAAQVPVSVTVPPGTAAARYPFRLDIVSAQRSGEDYEEGPTVSFEVAPTAPPPNRWWIWVAAAALLLVLGIGAWLALRPDHKPKEVEVPKDTTSVTDTTTTTVPEKPKVETVALKLFWNESRRDNFSTATADGEAAARAAGYAEARTEGYIFPTEQPGTVPLKLFWTAHWERARVGEPEPAVDEGHPGYRLRADNFTTATPDGEAAARAAAYTFARIEGYVFPTEQPDTVPLKLFWSEARGDNFTTATADGEASALAAGYVFVRVEGYVFKSGGAR